MPSPQARNWVFTLNNYSVDEKEHLHGNQSKFKYLIYGEEIGESGTPHLQGFVSFHKKQVLSTVRNIVSPRAHYEIARTIAEAINYCKKEGNFTEIGEPPKSAQGERCDLEQLHNAIKEGVPREQIRDRFFGSYLRYERSIVRYLEELSPARSWKTQVIVYWGKTGTGKTRQVFTFHSADNIYSHPGEQWFCGYDGHPIVLFDDFNGGEFKLCYLLKLLDRYPMRVPIKGGYVQWVPKVIYITSNKNPEDWYPNAYSEHRAALKRRLDVVTEFRHQWPLNGPFPPRVIPADEDPIILSDSESVEIQQQ